MRDLFLLISDALAGWASLFRLLADFSTTGGGYRGE